MVTAGTARLPYCINYAMGAVGARDFEFHRRMWQSLGSEIPLEVRCGPVDVPTFIVHGALDRVSPPASVQTLARVFPRNQVDVIEGVGHIPMVEAPRRTADDYLAFRAALG